MLGNMDGTAGLTLRALPDLVLDPEPHFERVPFRVNVPSGADKNGQGYRTWGSKQLAETFTEYLRARARTKFRWGRSVEGEKLTLDSPVVTVVQRKTPRGGKIRRKRFGDFVTAKDVVYELRRAIGRSGKDYRPYSLRSYFALGLESGQFKGLVTESVSRFWTGHNLGAHGRYTFGRAKVSPEVLEQERESYRKVAEAFLETNVRPKDGDRLLDFIEALGGKVEGGEKMAPAQLVKLLSEALARVSGEGERVQPGASRPALEERPNRRQMVVSNADVPRKLDEGWSWKAALGASRSVLSREDS